ncbi:antitermination protein, partial [Escherichia coli]|nr:antitermination protein [Escherichia coli]
GYADVIDKLVTKCWQEEAYAEIQLKKVTRKMVSAEDDDMMLAFSKKYG